MGEEKSKNIGDFTFDNYKEKNYDKNKETAIELMCRHFEFYEQLKSPNIEYATMGAKLSCTHGNKYIYLNAVKDHGVYDGENPVLTCKDCKVKENICDFGACGNGKFEPLYSEEAPHPAETALNQKGQKRYVCRPILLGEWGHGDINSRSLLIGEVYIDKEYKVYEEESANDGKPSEYILHCINTIESQNKTKNPIDAMQNREEVFGEYVEALMTCDNLLCLYGGVITIVENSDRKEETIAEEVPVIGIDVKQDNVLEEKLYEVDPSNAESVKKYMWNFFVDKGFEEVQVAGILGNVQQESQFNPYNINKNNGNYGLFQLSKDRQERYNKWIESEGLPGEEVVQNQCKFAIEEYDNPADTGWMNRGIRTKETIEYNGQIINYDVVSDGSQEDFLVADDPVEAAIIWGISFERCFGSKSQNGYYLGIQEQEERCKYALEIYDNRENLYYDE